jgi:hypothetical protein
MRLSFDKAPLFVKRMMLAKDSLRLLVDQKLRLQDKKTLHPNNGRRSTMKKRKCET